MVEGGGVPLARSRRSGGAVDTRGYQDRACDLGHHELGKQAVPAQDVRKLRACEAHSLLTCELHSAPYVQIDRGHGVEDIAPSRCETVTFDRHFGPASKRNCRGD